ncbi:MAG: ABC transporter ATP-binding protein [Clostridia bacterium]|nr:ABC transporter ATP-binding protein [Clostridia bacterium]
MKKSAFKLSTIKQVLHYTKKHRPLLLLSIILATITVALTLYIPIIIGQAIDLLDEGFSSVDFNAILELLVRIAIIVAIIALLQWIMNNINNMITYNVVKNVRDEAFCKIEKLPLKYIDSHPHGEIVSKIVADVDQFADGLLMGFTQLFTGVITILGTFIFLIIIDFKTALVVVLLTPLSLFIASFIAKKTYSMFQEQSRVRAEQTAIIDEMIGNLKVVKAFSHEDEAIEKFDEINQRLQKCSVKAIFFSSLVNPTTRFINSLVYASVALVGAFTVIGSAGVALSVGALVSVLSYATQFAKPFNEISGVVSELQNALACADRIFELINEDTETPDADDALLLEKVNGNVDIKDVCFSYSPDKRLIENLNLSVKNGQRIAIVGPTGCGKTTIINLLMRFYDVCSGSICVDNNDIRSIKRASLRESYGMVLQETWIRNASIRDNIAIGKPDATDDEIIEAAKLSHAHSFIKRLPQGYNTIVAEESSLLSQGQKQLLCIARIMLALPPMLILDEATSSIDTRTEIKIQDAFATMMKGRTSFIVAHRLSTIREADAILVMDSGKIIEQGTHTELLQKKGFYYNLYNSQFEGQ